MQRLEWESISHYSWLSLLKKQHAAHNSHEHARVLKHLKAASANAAALDESGNSLAAGGRRPAVHRRALCLPRAGDGVLQRGRWLGGLENESATHRGFAGHSRRRCTRVSSKAGPRAHATDDVRRRRDPRGAGQGRGPLRAATDRKGRVRHGTRPASSIGFSWSAFDRV